MNSHAEATLQDPPLAGGSGVTSPLSADGSESNMAVAVASARRLARGDEQGRRPGSAATRFTVKTGNPRPSPFASMRERGYVTGRLVAMRAGPRVAA